MTHLINKDWQEARLIPIHGITSGKEAENRATSALLAVMKGVPSFAAKLFENVKTPKIKLGNISTYIQAPFVHQGETYQPDGIISIDGKGIIWGSLVEVKTGTDKLETHQLETYIKIAEDNGFNALLTISNQISPILGQHPYASKLPNTNVELIHFSWAYISTQATVLKEYLGIEDREQDWILSEFIRYIESSKSGVQDFNDMGSQWTNQIDNLRNKVFDKNSDEARILVNKLMSLTGAATLKLTAKLGRNVTPVYSKESLYSETQRIEEQLNNLAIEGVFKATIKVENTYSDIYVEVDMARRQIICSTYMDVKDNRSEIKKAKWLLKQVEKLETPIRIKTKFKRGRKGDGIAISSSTITMPEQLLEEGKSVVSFKLSLSSAMGESKTFRARNSFIQSFYDAIDTAYDTLILKFKVYEEPLPLIRTSPTKEETEAIALEPEKVNSWNHPNKTEETLVVPDDLLTSSRPSILPPPVIRSN